MYLWFYRYEHIILQKEGISKHSGKQENFAIGLDSCYLFNLEHGAEHEIDSAYGICMHCMHTLYDQWIWQSSSL